MFRQYDAFTKDTFEDFLKQAVYRFKKICLIMDKASQHRASNIRKLLEGTDGLEIVFLPTATPDLSAIETYRGISRGQSLTCRTPACACFARRSPGTRGTKNQTSSLKTFCTGPSESSSIKPHGTRSQRMPCTMLQVPTIPGVQGTFTTYLDINMRHNSQMQLPYQAFMENFDMNFSLSVYMHNSRYQSTN